MKPKASPYRYISGVTESGKPAVVRGKAYPWKDGFVTFNAVDGGAKSSSIRAMSTPDGLRRGGRPRGRRNDFGRVPETGLSHPEPKGAKSRYALLNVRQTAI